jgi:hypothetical protein
MGNKTLVKNGRQSPPEMTEARLYTPGPLSLPL